MKVKLATLIVFVLLQANIVRAEDVIKLNYQYATTVSVLDANGDMVALDVDLEKIDKSINAKLINNKRTLVLSPKRENTLRVGLTFCADGYQHQFSLISVEKNPDIRIELRHDDFNHVCDKIKNQSRNEL